MTCQHSQLLRRVYFVLTVECRPALLLGPAPLVAAVADWPRRLGAPGLAHAVRVQNVLPVAYLADALLAAQVLLDVGGAGRVVQLVPIRLERLVVELLLFVAPAPAALPLLGCAVQVVVLFLRRPVGQRAARRGVSRGPGGERGRGGGRGGARWAGFGEGGFRLDRLLALGPADGLEPEGCWAGRCRASVGEGRDTQACCSTNQDLWPSSRAHHLCRGRPVVAWEAGPL